MLFNLGLILALSIFCVGLAVRLAWWHRDQVGAASLDPYLYRRLGASFKAALGALFSAKFGTLVKALVLDGVFHRRILRDDFGRWLAHLLIYGGFMLLLLMHALEKVISANLFSDYASTVNPFMFLRNLFGVMVLVGIVLAILRRRTKPLVKATTGPMDVYAIVLVLVIILSGFVLEGAKIISPSNFDRMVELYGDIRDDEELKGLKAFWAKEYGVAFLEPAESSPELLDKGKDVHESKCLNCHSRPASAFLSFALAGIFRPMAAGLEAVKFDQIVWYIHWLACFIGLAYLPFSKMFHLVTTPLSVMVNAVAKKDGANPSAWAAKQKLELDACTHCAACTTHCSVGVYFRPLGNRAILPSEKLAATKAMLTGYGLYTSEFKALAEGNSICTRCYRCTTVCPAGINLQEMWFSLQDGLAARGLPEPYPAAQAKAGAAAAPSRKAEKLVPGGVEFRAGLGLSSQAASFSQCYSCQTCTNACPVVATYADPKKELDLLPHQIMHLLGLGLKEEAVGAGMVWNCLTCYHCQEACPQGVRVTDVLYELRNLASGAGRAKVS